MPVISSSEPPSGFNRSVSESSDGKATHSRPRELTRRPGEGELQGQHAVLFQAQRGDRLDIERSLPTSQAN
jgi:hypothetical protein